MSPQFLQGCDRRSCYPATGNLLIGRGNEEYLTSTDTCGLENPEKYCIISSIDSQTYRRGGSQGSVSEKCYNCDASNESLAHGVENIIHRYSQTPGVSRRQQKMTWWQVGTSSNLETLIQVLHSGQQWERERLHPAGPGGRVPRDSHHHHLQNLQTRRHVH